MIQFRGSGPSVGSNVGAVIVTYTILGLLMISIVALIVTYYTILGLLILSIVYIIYTPNPVLIV